jgi:hypothetical protein
LPKFVLGYGVHNASIVHVVHWNSKYFISWCGYCNGKFQVTTLVLREPCRYCILGFCSMMNVYRIITSFSVRICLTSFNHGKVSKVPFHSCPKPHQVPFPKQRLSVEVQDTPWKAK